MGIQAANAAAIKISRLEGRLLRLRKEAAKCHAEIAHIEAKLAAFRVVLPELADGEDVPEFPPRVPSKPKDDGSMMYGERSRTILDFLRRKDGVPASTVDILNYIIDTKGLPLSNLAERDQLRRRIKERFGALRKRGLLERPEPLPGEKYPRWCLATRAAFEPASPRPSALPPIFPGA